MSELTASMTTQGLGRYLIDLPASWRFGDGEVTLYYGLGSDFEKVEVSIIAQGVTPAQFQAAVSWRAQRIQDITNEKTHRPMLVGAWPEDVRIDDGKGGADRQAMLMRYYRRTNGDSAHIHEMQLLIDETYIQLKTDSFDNATAPAEDRLKALATQIFRVNDPARAGTGFILGPIVIRGTQDHEQATIKFYDPNRLDITLEINSSAVTPDESRHLLQRYRESGQVIREMGGKTHTLREGVRAFAGMHGEEAVATSDATLDGKDVHGLLFNAETYRPDPGLMKPTLMVQLEAGGSEAWSSDAQKLAERAAPDYLMSPYNLPNFIVPPDNLFHPRPKPPVTSASLTDYEATTLWDAILPTIRQRPGAAPSPKPNVSSPSPVSPEQAERAERDRQALDAFIANAPAPLNPPKD